MRYLFETFTLDTDRRELRSGDGPVAVEPKVFDLLACLIAQRGRVVGKDDLIAEVWGGRIVSDAALSTCINAARTAIGDSGGAQRLIRTLPRKGLRFVGDVREEPSVHVEASAGDAPAPALPDRPSLAVLPFANLGGDPEQEYFADGMVEEMITALSRLRWLFVVARNSSFTYKGIAVDAKRIGRELGVRYLLEGSVRRAADRIRITGQLIDTSTGTYIWADRFEGAPEDIFALQDRVTESVVGAIAPRLEQAEIVRAQRKPSGSLGAYDLYLRGMARFYARSREANDEALALLYRAIELDPDFAPSYAMASLCYHQRKAQGWVTDRECDIAEVSKLAATAVRVGADDAGALCVAGFTIAYVLGNLEDGAGHVERALDLNPNLAAAQFAGGYVKVWLGEPDTAVERFAVAMRLSPVDPLIYVMQVGVAHAHFFAGRHDEAASWARKALRARADGHAGYRIAAASYALTGRAEEARRMVEHLQRIDATLRVANLRETLGPYRNPEHLRKYEDALRKAGLPE
ncbi:MAG: winged helix-turn-helix domain-containing protein [Alphaproteobacteria bacterium]|nr:winged helix-turn-helix domain-containing protein [Alphaproteobacteria bacterium]